MEATTWLDRQQEQAGDSGVPGAGAAMPLILWAIVLIGTSGATAARELPLWAYALFVASPAVLLLAALALRPLLRPLAQIGLRRRPC